MNDLINVGEARERYETFSHKTVIDKSYKAARAVLESAGFTCANDDRAEELIGAIMYYVTESADEDITKLRINLNNLFNEDGENDLFPIVDWRQEVENGDTKLGYQEWVLHKAEEHNFSL